MSDLDFGLFAFCSIFFLMFLAVFPAEGFVLAIGLVLFIAIVGLFRFWME